MLSHKFVWKSYERAAGSIIKKVGNGMKSSIRFSSPLNRRKFLRVTPFTYVRPGGQKLNEITHRLDESATVIVYAS